MKLKVFEKEQEEKEVYLALEERSDGIILIAVDKYGDLLGAGHLLKIKYNGMILRYMSIEPDLGFQLDSKGRIKIEGVE